MKVGVNIQYKNLNTVACEQLIQVSDVVFYMDGCVLNLIYAKQ